MKRITITNTRNNYYYCTDQSYEFDVINDELAMIDINSKLKSATIKIMIKGIAAKMLDKFRQLEKAYEFIDAYDGLIELLDYSRETDIFEITIEE